MADIYDKEKRSEIMSHIRSKNTKPEVALRKELFSLGFRYRVNDKRLVGKPDIVLPKYRTVVFLHGCFWHGHDGCKFAYTPKSNTEFWTQKIQSNKERDIQTRSLLEEKGWKVIVIWECEVKTREQRILVAKEIARRLKEQG